MKRTADEIMERGGFLPTDTGPCVTILREQTREQVEHHGLVNRSPGTWGPAAIDYETGEWKIDAEARAKALLAIEWRIRHGHTYRVECIGPPWGWRFDPATRGWSFRIKWRTIRPWLGDINRHLGMRYRIWRDRNMVNPYE